MKTNRKIISLLITTMLVIFPINISKADQSTADLVANFVYTGKIGSGISILQKKIESNPKNGEAIFCLGTLHFIHALEGLQQDLYRYGAGNTHSKSSPPALLRSFLPVFRTPVPSNPNPEVASYEKARAIFVKFVDRLKKADETLSKIKETPFKVPLDWAKIRIDANGDGEATKQEEIFSILSRTIARQRNQTPPEVSFKITFDTADAYWLRGYTNVLMSIGNYFLSFDFEKSYDVSFHAIFGNSATKFGRQLNDVKWDPKDLARLMEKKAALQEKIDKADLSPQDKQRLDEIQKENRAIWRDKDLSRAEKRQKTAQNKDELNKLKALKREPRLLKSEMRALEKTIKSHEARNITNMQSWGNIYDLVSYYLTIDWAVVEPDRLKAVRQNLLTVMQLNKTTWRLVSAETDDDNEWLPNPNQKSPFSSLKVTQETIDNWLKTVGLIEDVLEGRLLVSHPRFVQGINMKRFFEEAKHFNLVLFSTGPGAIQFVEPGPVWDQTLFRALSQPMGRNFGAYALWFN